MKNNKTKEPFNKKHVIDVASRLFFVKGYSYTSMDEVTRISGVSKSNIYYHFKSKDELLVAVIDYWISHYQELIKEAVANPSQSVEERMITFLASIATEIMGRDYKGSCPFITLYIQSPMEPNIAKEKITNFFQQLQPVFVELFQQGVESGEFRKTLNCVSTGSLFLATMEGAILLSETMKDTSNLVTTAKAFCEMLY